MGVGGDVRGLVLLLDLCAKDADGNARARDCVVIESYAASSDGPGHGQIKLIADGVVREREAVDPDLVLRHRIRDLSSCLVDMDAYGRGPERVAEVRLGEA